MTENQQTPLISCFEQARAIAADAVENGEAPSQIQFFAGVLAAIYIAESDDPADESEQDKLLSAVRMAVTDSIGAVVTIMGREEPPLTRQECLDIAAYYERDADDLEARYGTGVRPGWVSADISIAMHRAARWRAQADEAAS